jgi:hypothetical protein
MPATFPDWYGVLGLTPGASREEIQNAYRRLSRACHPDAEGDDGLFRLITAARDDLLAQPRRPGQRPRGPDPRPPGPVPRPQRGDASRGQQGSRRRELGPSTADSYRWRVPGSSGWFGDFLVRLPTPRRGWGWVAAFVAWVFLGTLVGAYLSSVSLLGPLVELCVFVLFPLLIIAAVVKSQLRQQVLGYLDYYRRRGGPW